MMLASAAHYLRASNGCFLARIGVGPTHIAPEGATLPCGCNLVMFSRKTKRVILAGDISDQWCLVTTILDGLSEQCAPIIPFERDPV